MRRALAVFIAILPGVASAQAFKPTEIGGGLYTSTISADASGVKDDRFSGIALTGKAILNPYFAMKGVMAFQNHRDLSKTNSKSLDASLLFGAGMGTNGWKAYIGPGLFVDFWQTADGSEAFAGAHLALGLGYNWDNLALDAWGTMRAPGDYEVVYEDSFGVAEDLTVMSFGVGLSVRF